MSLEPLAPAALYRRADAAALGFKTTAELEDPAAPLGQARALAALAFGTGIKSPGYNLFALGPSAVGKHTIIRRHLEQVAAAEAVPPDWCYVHNFKEPHKPRALKLPAGQGHELRRDMEQLVDETVSGIHALFEGENYRTRREAIDEEFRERQSNALESFGERARGKGVALIRTPVGLALAPMKDGEVVPPEVFHKLPREEQEKTGHDIEDLQGELRALMQQMPRVEKERRERIRELDREITMFAVGQPIETLRDKYRPLPDVVGYLEAVRDGMIERAAELRPREEESSQLPFMMRGPSDPAATFRRFRVNVIVGRGENGGAPVVFEDNPGYANLVGRVEHLAEMGALVTDFSLIKPGALHRANGGYLMIDASKLLTAPFAWEALKRALKSREIRIDSPGQSLGLMTTVSLEPEPIPLDLKVVLLGERRLYYLLCAYEPEFGELFKVEADFAEDLDRDGTADRDFAAVIGWIARDQKLKPLDAPAAARVIEHASRLADDAGKVSIRMGRITDLLCESDYWAGQSARTVIASADVERAIAAQIYRADRIRERAQEAILRETLLIDTDGAKVGQVNGLAVLSLGTFAFGRPSRITARVRIGRGEVVDIEREVELGGPIHAKGVLILAAFLSTRYATSHPLSLSATLVFEQSYSGVEGDSASSTELYALLSAVADLPIAQGFAVTGSVNQFGEVQAIGGVNEKIEGFFDICAKRGLSGRQGILIPAANVKHLMLRHDVVAACAAGTFAIYPVATIDQGIEVLTGTPAGARGPDGKFTAGSVNAKVEARLIELAETRRRFAAEAKNEARGT